MSERWLVVSVRPDEEEMRILQSMGWAADASAAAAGAGAGAAGGGGGPGVGLSIEEIDEGGEVAAGHGAGGLTIEEPDEQDPIPEIDED